MSTEPESNPRQQKAKAFFDSANQAALKNNFEYAIQMYREACKLVPDSLVFRQALRGVERRHFNNDPAKVGRLAGAKTQPIKLRARTAKAQGHWGQVLEICEEAFVHNPWSVSISQDAAEAAEHLGHPALAQWLMESVLAQAGNDAHFFRHLAHVYGLNENWQRAINCWERVKQLDPADETAARQINALSASATITRSGLHQKIERREADATSEAESTSAAEVESLRRQSLTPEQRFEQEIREHPDQIGPYLERAEGFKAHGRLDEARDLLARGLKAHPNDPTLQEAFAEIQIARIRKVLDSLTRRTHEAPADAEARTKLAQLTAKLQEYELAEYRRRVAARPDDPHLHYELGLRLARAGQHDAAIAAFQQCRSSPERKVQALHQAGLSFEANGVPKLAERAYQEALKAVDPDDPATLNALHYRLGRVAEAQGNLDAAEEHYNEVAANDYAYLDVAQRLRNLNQRS
ncbi:MAG TPA: tetratricopeptide repeat protein [Isosphaeraceae bacterium]|jgi:tetratricopeptide (TPR) repeat protein